MEQVHYSIGHVIKAPDLLIRSSSGQQTVVLLGLILSLVLQHLNSGEPVLKCGFERRLQLYDLSGDRSINSPCIIGQCAQLIIRATADENEIQGKSTNEWTCKWIMIPHEEETGLSRIVFKDLKRTPAV